MSEGDELPDWLRFIRDATAFYIRHLEQEHEHDLVLQNWFEMPVQDEESIH